jgi:hypothetical protein
MLGNVKVNVLSLFHVKHTQMINTITINVPQLASDLAHDAARTEMITSNIIKDEAEMYDGDSYTDNAQPIFDRWLAHYNEIILNCSN